MAKTALYVNQQPGGLFSIQDIENHPGSVWFVDSTNAGNGDADGYGYNPETAPFKTIKYAASIATADDVIYVMPGHVETLTAATSMALSTAGISVLGLGVGSNRPKITIGTAATATIAISGNNIAFKNIIVMGALDGLNAAITVTGDDCDIDIEYRDTSSTVESNIGILATSVDRGTFKLRYIGFIAGNAVTNAIVLDGCTACEIDVDFYGVASTAVVEFLNTACHNIFIKGKFHNSGTTDLSKNVIDTPTGSTWFVSGFDKAAGCPFSGGSGAAIAKDDMSAYFTADQSYMLVQAAMTRSYMLVQATADQSYMLVQATADQSYTLVQTTLVRSHMLVQAELDRSHMLVQAVVDQSYMLVCKDLILSYILNKIP